MKKKLLILTVFILFAFVALPNIFAQTAQRITFKKGAKQLIVSGSLNSYRSKKVFVIRVRRGQTLKTEQSKSDLSSHYITVYIKAPNGADVDDSDASCNNRKEVTPTGAGDYRIEVFECQKADAWRGSFKLKIRVE
ncbi:MAG: hypothetical protein ABJA66_07015 [Actinomycetota bacterium]